MQATDHVIPSQSNRMYVGLAGARRSRSEEYPTSKMVYSGNRMVHAQATDSEEKNPLQDLESLQNGQFPSVDTYRSPMDSHTKKLIFCSQVASYNRSKLSQISKK